MSTPILPHSRLRERAGGKALAKQPLLHGVFDQDPTRRPDYRDLLREFAARAAGVPRLPEDAQILDGHGQPVLVISGFCTTDVCTLRLRRHLARCNFRPFGARIGMNFGPTDRLLRRLDRRLDHIVAQYGPTIVIGVSMGGLLARHLAYERPADIRHVVTIASPFVFPTVSAFEPLVRLCAFRYSKTAPFARLATPLPVPSTMFYTPDDGVVSPESCWRTLEGGAVVPLKGAHLTIADHPDTILAVTSCLALHASPVHQALGDQAPGASSSSR